MSVLKFVSLAVAVWLTLVNGGRLLRGQNIPPINLIFQAIGITAFVYLQWLV